MSQSDMDHNADDGVEATAPDDVEATAPDDVAVQEVQDAAPLAGSDSALLAEGEVAADYLEGLLDIVDVGGDIDIDVENGRAAVAVVEANPGELADLVGPGGRVLEALQELTRLAVARETGHRSRLMLDLAGYRAERRRELERMAASAIAEAKAANGPVRLDAMNAFERKVVHDAVAAAGLSSESEGSDPQRYVVVSPA